MRHHAGGQCGIQPLAVGDANPPAAVPRHAVPDPAPPFPVCRRTLCGCGGRNRRAGIAGAEQQSAQPVLPHLAHGYHPARLAMRADRARLDRTHGCPLRLRGVDVGVGRAIAGQLGAGSVQVERRTVPVRRNACAVPAEQSQPVAGREIPGSRRAGEGVRRRLRIAHHADALQRAPPHLIQSPDVPAVGGAAEQCQRPGGVAAHGTARDLPFSQPEHGFRLSQRGAALQPRHRLALQHGHHFPGAVDVRQIADCLHGGGILVPPRELLPGAYPVRQHRQPDQPPARIVHTAHGGKSPRAPAQPVEVQAMEIVCHPTAVGRFARRVHDALGVLLPVGAEAAVQGVFFQTDAQYLPSPSQQQADIRRADAGFGGGGGGQDNDSLGVQETRLPLPARDGFVRRLVAEAVPGQFAQKALCRVGIGRRMADTDIGTHGTPPSGAERRLAKEKPRRR